MLVIDLIRPGVGSQSGTASPLQIAVKVILWVGVSAAAVFAVAFLADWDRLRSGVTALAGEPWLVAGMAAGYTLAFLLRAMAWRALLTHRVGIFRLYTALQAALLANHLLPLKLGEGIRPLLVRRHNVPLGEAVATTAVARATDFCFLAGNRGRCCIHPAPFRRRSDVGAGVGVADGRGGWGRGGAVVYPLAPLSSLHSNDFAAPFRRYPFPAS